MFKLQPSYMIHSRVACWHGHQLTKCGVLIWFQIFGKSKSWTYWRPNSSFPSIAEMFLKALCLRPSSSAYAKNSGPLQSFQVSGRPFPDNIWTFHTGFLPVFPYLEVKKKKSFMGRICLHFTSREERLFFAYCLLRNVYLTAC